MNGFARTPMRNIAIALGLSFVLAGCTYPDLYRESDYAYYDEYCDPNVQYDEYYECDNLNGFGDIGFAGGYFRNLYYPGFGLYAYDNFGNRFALDDAFGRYWGQRRHAFVRERLLRRGGVLGRNVRRPGRGVNNRGLKNDGRQGRRARARRNDGVGADIIDEARRARRAERREERGPERAAGRGPERRAEGGTRRQPGSDAATTNTNRSERRAGRAEGRTERRIERQPNRRANRNGLRRAEGAQNSTGNRRAQPATAAPRTNARPAKPSKPSTTRTQTRSKPEASQSKPSSESRPRPTRSSPPRIQRPRTSPRTSTIRRRNPTP